MSGSEDSSYSGAVRAYSKRVKMSAMLRRREHSPLFVREESAERCQYYGEKLVRFGSNHPKLRFIIEQKWYNR